MIDTGFTGFLMMPLTESFELALTLYGTSSWTLADGSSQPKLLGFGTVILDDVHTHGVIVLEPNASRPLLGMEFLRRSKRALAVGSGGCLLIDEEFMSTELAKANKPDPANPPSEDSGTQI